MRTIISKCVFPSLCLVLGLLISAGAATAGEKWIDSTGTSVNTNNKNADLIRRAQSRQNNYINKTEGVGGGGMSGDGRVGGYFWTSPTGEVFYCPPE